MKSYFVLNDQEESGHYSPIRNQHGSSRILTDQLDAGSAGFMPARDQLTNDIETLRNKGRAKTPLFTAKIWKLLLPLFIATALAFLTVSMGRYIGTRTSQTATTSLSDPPVPEQSLPAARPVPDVINNGRHDSVAVLPSRPSTPVEASALSPKTHAVRDESAGKEKYYRENWAKYMTVSNSKYKRRLLGGIKDLAITFTNNTDYPVDEVVTEITYIKANGKPWKTQLVSIANIAPHAVRQQPVPNVSRSKSVQVSIQKITSLRLQLTYNRSDSNAKERAQ
jgi:hypothetical protein